MKYVFSIQTSEDGICPAVTTNIKALFNYIDSLGMHPLTLFDGVKNVPYNYNNLVKHIRHNQIENRLHVATIYCKFDTSISISDLLVKTK